MNLATFKIKLKELLRKKNTKDAIIKHKGTRMAKDGKDLNIRITNDKLEKCSLNVLRCLNHGIAPSTN